MNFDGCKLALTWNNKLLVYKRDANDAIPYPNQWDLPGGGREYNETPEQCVLRELHEEFGFELEVADLQKRYQYSLANKKVAYFFICKLKLEQKPSINFGNEGQYWQWIPVAEFTNNKNAISHLAKLVEKYILD